MSAINKILKEIKLHINARYPVIYIVSYEEGVVIQCIKQLAEASGKSLYLWSISEGLHKINEKPEPKLSSPFQALKKIDELTEKAIIIMKDFHPYLTEPHEQYLEDPIRVRRKFRDVITNLKTSFKTIILLSPVLRLPRELEKDIIVMDFPLPDLEEIEKIITRKIEMVRKNYGINLVLEGELKERYAKAALGLTRAEVENVLNKAIVNDCKLTEDDLIMIVSEKKQILRKTGLLEYYEVQESFANVGGLDNLKEWLLKRGKAFSEEAKQFGLPQPKGILLLGVQGCGKSLISKTISALWKLPLLRFDPGNIFGSYIGESEENMRRALKIAEALAPSILWIDEIEKGFAGSSGSGNADSGVTRRIFGTFITWMQEKKSPVFIIATANSVEELPAELLRKGRFDEIFFVDLPSYSERKEIFKIHLRIRNRIPENFDLELLAKETEGFSGAEIEQAVISGLYDAYYDNKRELTTEDVLKAIKETVPLSITMKEQINYLRQWAQNRARPASKKI